MRRQNAQRSFARRLAPAFGSALVVVAVGLGCSSSPRPSAFGSGNQKQNFPDAGGTFQEDSGDPGPPGCGTLADGGTCTCQDVPTLIDVPNIYFVLDHSGSMSEGTKWNDVRVAISKVMKDLGPRANFGAAQFPDPSNGQSCAAGKEIMSVRPGDSPPGTQGPTTAYLLQATESIPFGGTPTSATLGVLTPTLNTLPGKTVVILATDGAPNCDPNAFCGASGCELNIESINGCTPTGPSCCLSDGDANCLDGDALIAAVSALKNDGIETYVIGVPGSEPYAALLDSVAVAGGTVNYFGATDATSLASALSVIAAKIDATCTFPLKVDVDPSDVNVYLDETLVPQDPTNGWTLDGTTVTLVGSSCQSVLNGDVLDIRIITGCPTVTK